MIVSGDIDQSTGEFTFSGPTNTGWFGDMTFTGTASPDGNSVSGNVSLSGLGALGPFAGERIGYDPIGDCQDIVGEAACDVPGEFTVGVQVDDIDLADVDADTKAGYRGLQVRLDYPAELVLKNRDDLSEVVWPDCATGTASELKLTGSYLVACGVGLGQNESTFLGRVVEVDFNCTEAGVFQVELVPGVSLGTHLFDESGVDVSMAKSHTQTIICGLPANVVEPPTPTPKDPDGDTDGDTVPNSEDTDDDNDGCTDVQEVGSDPNFGGLRNPRDFWDFMDVPAGATLERDKVVVIQDIGAVVARFGAQDAGAGTFDRTSDPLSTPNQVSGDLRENYHPAYDRGAPNGPYIWNRAPPDGAIVIQDIQATVGQFGHSCL